jgi:energy-coupling factor transporter ATP-binding protein EcfA2
VVAAPENRLQELTGEPGSGKSTLLRYLLVGILEPLPWAASAFKGAFPLMIELREFHAMWHADKCADFLEYVAYMGKAEQWSMDDQAVDEELQNGPSVVMFDGLDEIFDGADRERVMQAIVGFALPQIQSFINGWIALTFPHEPQLAEQRIQRVPGSLERSRSIRLLAGNPMLLTIMASSPARGSCHGSGPGFTKRWLDERTYQGSGGGEPAAEPGTVGCSRPGRAGAAGIVARWRGACSQVRECSGESELFGVDHPLRSATGAVSLTHDLPGA